MERTEFILLTRAAIIDNYSAMVSSHSNSQVQGHYMAGVIVIAPAGKKHEKILDIEPELRNHYEAYRKIGEELKIRLPIDETDQCSYMLAYACQGFIAMTLEGDDISTYFPPQITEQQYLAFEAEIKDRKGFNINYAHVDNIYNNGDSILNSNDNAPISGTVVNYDEDENWETILHFAMKIQKSTLTPKQRKLSPGEEYKL